MKSHGLIYRTTSDQLRFSAQDRPSLSLADAGLADRFRRVAAVAGGEMKWRFRTQSGPRSPSKAVGGIANTGHQSEQVKSPMPLAALTTDRKVIDGSLR